MKNIYKYIEDWPAGKNGWIPLLEGDYRIPLNGSENVAGFISWNSNVCVIFVNEEKQFIHVAMLNLSGMDIPDMVADSIIEDFFSKSYHKVFSFNEIPIPRFLKGKVMPSRHFRAEIRRLGGSTPWKEYYGSYFPDIDDDYDCYLRERDYDDEY